MKILFATLALSLLPAVAFAQGKADTPRIHHEDVTKDVVKDHRNHDVEGHETVCKRVVIIKGGVARKHFRCS